MRKERLEIALQPVGNARILGDPARGFKVNRDQMHRLPDAAIVIGWNRRQILAHRPARSDNPIVLHGSPEMWEVGVYFRQYISNRRRV